MELLVVIAILGLLVTVMLPFQGRMTDDTKRKETIQLLESIRFGLLGAENAYDANGNRVIGGYVGDYGTLPDFVVHEWDATQGWTIPEHASVADNPEIMEWNETDTTTHDNHDSSIMPLNLWTNTVRIDGVTDPQNLMEPTKDWNGPYVVPPRDDYKSDDDLYTYTAPSSSSAPSGSPLVHNDEARHFLLRQGEGRLTDGWGSALHIYFDASGNLYFVSAGSDRRINFGNPTASPPDFGPADPTLDNNDDNLVLVITREQWNLTDQKIATTKKKLADLKTAILGIGGKITDGVIQPNGFIADMGSMELLTGSYVHDGTNVYKCIETHISAGSFSVGDDWVAVTGSTSPTGKTISDYPTVPLWSAGREYIGAQPQLLLSNAHYVREADKYYRYVNETKATGQTPAAGSVYWVEDTSFEGNAWGVQEYSASREYSRNSMTEWAYYRNVNFGAGWRGPYVSDYEAPLTDAFGREIRFDLDSSGNVILHSFGEDETDPLDDIVETIPKSSFAIPLTVTAKLPTGTSATNTDYVVLFMPYNGKVAYIEATLHAGNGTQEGEFLFTEDTEFTILPITLSDLTSDVTGFRATTPYALGVRIPISTATAVYHHSLGTVKLQKTFALHPLTTPTVVLGE